MPSISSILAARAASAAREAPIAAANKEEDSGSQWLDGVLGSSLDELLDNPRELARISLSNLPVTGHGTLRASTKNVAGCTGGAIADDSTRAFEDRVPVSKSSQQAVPSITSQFSAASTWENGARQPRTPSQGRGDSTSPQGVAGNGACRAAAPDGDLPEMCEACDDDRFAETVGACENPSQPSSTTRVRAYSGGPAARTQARSLPETLVDGMLRQPQHAARQAVSHASTMGQNQHELTVHYLAHEKPMTELTLDGGHGMHVLVDTVVQGSKAYNAGVRKGFALTRMNGRTEFKQLPGWQVRLLLEAPIKLDFDPAPPLMPTSTACTEIRLSFSPRASLGMPPRAPLFGPGDGGRIVEEVVFTRQAPPWLRPVFDAAELSCHYDDLPPPVKLPTAVGEQVKDADVVEGGFINSQAMSHMRARRHSAPSDFRHTRANAKRMGVYDSAPMRMSSALPQALCVQENSIACGVDECLEDDLDDFMEFHAPLYPELHIAPDATTWPEHWKSALLAGNVAAPSSRGSTETPTATGRSESTTAESSVAQQPSSDPWRASRSSAPVNGERIDEQGSARDSTCSADSHALENSIHHESSAASSQSDEDWASPPPPWVPVGPDGKELGSAMVPRSRSPKSLRLDAARSQRPASQEDDRNTTQLSSDSLHRSFVDIARPQERATKDDSRHGIGFQAETIKPLEDALDSVRGPLGNIAGIQRTPADANVVPGGCESDGVTDRQRSSPMWSPPAAQSSVWARLKADLEPRVEQSSKSGTKDVSGIFAKGSRAR